MKTNTIAQHPVQFRTPKETAAVTCLPGLGRFLLAVLCAALVSFTAAPAALAAGIDGEYLFTRATGTITAGGETQELPQELVQQLAASQSGGLVIKNNKITIDRKVVVRLLNKLKKEYGATVKYKLTGPTSIKFNKHGKVFTANTSKPVVATFDITIPMPEDPEPMKIKGNLKSDFDAKVKGKVLTLKVPISGKLMGKPVSAELTIICTRQ
jgi:hypothetical protein